MVTPTKCARTACDSLNGRFVHRDLPGLYCYRCAVKINAYAGFDLIDISEATAAIEKAKSAGPDDWAALHRAARELTDK